MKLTSCVISVLLLIVSCQTEEVTKNETRLDSYVESFEIPDLGFSPQLKVVFEYNTNGDLMKYTVYSYNPASAQMEAQRYYEFSYANHAHRVERIKGYLNSSSDLYVEYQYEYFADGTISKVKENNYAATVNSEATFAYPNAETVKVSYVYSNGGSFDYEFHYSNGNMINDKTTRGSVLCSNGIYTYDQNKNPFKTLGYVDYQLSNWSVNNRITEQVNYLDCAFPELVPESYSYEYNAEGYPTSSITLYKSGAALKKSKKEFLYRAVQIKD